MAEPVTLTECIEASQADLKILLVIPSPLNDPARLHPEPELREIFAAVDALRVSVDLIRLFPPTLPALRVALASGQFDIMHFAMHGGSEELVFEDNDGIAAHVSYDEFAALFHNSTTIALILNGCSTEPLGDRIALLAPNTTVISIAGDIPRSHAHTTVAKVYGLVLSGLSPAYAASAACADLLRKNDRAASHASSTHIVRARGPAIDQPLFTLVQGRSRTRYFGCEPRSNVMTLHHPIFDRERETLKLNTELFRSDADTAFVGVVGITGTGKTALARSFATRYGWRFPDGIAYFALGEDFFVESVAAFFGWRLGELAAEAAIDEVARRLAQTRALLIFDDVENASDRAIAVLVALLSSWDARLGGRAILIFQTYRSQFQQLIGANWIGVGRLPADAACDLVVSCLGGAERARRMVGDEIADTAELCFGHPRTIESTAALLGLGHAWEDLKGDLERLSRDGPLSANNEVLGRVIARLEAQYPIVKDLLDALSVFSGTCRESTWRAVTASATGQQESLGRFLGEALSQLQFARLIERHDVRGETWCVMHPLVVAHLRDCHRSLSDAKRRTYVKSHLAEQVRIDGTDPDYPTNEWKNLRRVLNMAADLAMWPTILEYCDHVVGHLSDDLIRRGPWQLAAELLEIAERASRESEALGALARSLVMKGAIQYRLADFDAAGAAYAEAMETAERADAPTDRLLAMRGMGQVAYRTGDFIGAEETYRFARTLAAGTGEIGMADIDHQLGKILYRQGDLRQAREVLLTVYRTREFSGDTRNWAKTTHELGRVEHAAGHYEDARRYYMSALDLLRSCNDPVTEQATLFQLGRLALDEEEIDQAVEWFELSRQISENLPDRVWMAHADFGRALVAHARGADREARAKALDAVDAGRLLRVGLVAEVENWLVATGLRESVPEGSGE